MTYTSSHYSTDDLQALREHLAGEQLHYHDISTLQAYQASLKRWPLLAEIHRLLESEHADLSEHGPLARRT